MIDHRAQEALRRSVEALAIGIPQAKERREAELFASAGQVAQHVPVRVKGKVGRSTTTTTLRLRFPAPFVQLDKHLAGPLDTPTPSYGVEIHSGGVVILQPQITQWTKDDRGFIVGALARLIAWAPDAPKAASFEATVHFTFYGFGAEDED